MTKRAIQVQPSSYTDQMVSREEYGQEPIELTKKPYPFAAWADNGHLINPEFWQGTPFRIIGFCKTNQPGTVDLFWQEAEFQDNPQKAVGMYVVTQDKGGGMAVHTTAIEEVKVFELEEDQ